MSQVSAKYLDSLSDKSLVDQEERIIIQGLKPLEKVTVKLFTNDREDHLWTSFAKFQADDHGTIDVATQAPYEGSYTSSDSMGLFWSLASKSSLTLFIPKNHSIDYTISLFDENENLLETKDFKRFLYNNIEMRAISSSLLTAELCIPQKRVSNHLVITLTGSNGGKSPHKARLLASHGHLTCALAYFHEASLPQHLENIPLEYFIGAFKELRKIKDLSFDKIILYGTSKGAEAALLIATYFPDEVSAVIANVPTNVVGPSPGNNEESSWTFQNKPLSFLPPPEKITEEDITTNLSAVFLRALEEHKNHIESAKIPLNDRMCSTVLISGENDMLWPSHYFANEIEKTLKKLNVPVTHLSYKNTGHIISFPYLPTSTSLLYHPLLKLNLETGGSPASQNFACKDAWEKVLEFLESN